MVESKMRVGIRATETMVHEEKKGIGGIFEEWNVIAKAWENATEVASNP